MVYFVNTVAVFIIVYFLIGIFLVHSFQYRLMDGEIFNSGGITEIFSFIFLLVISCMHYQKEVTQEDIQQKMDKFEEALSRKSVKSMKNEEAIVVEAPSEDLVIHKYGSEQSDILSIN